MEESGHEREIEIFFDLDAWYFFRCGSSRGGVCPKIKKNQTTIRFLLLILNKAISPAMGPPIAIFFARKEGTIKWKITHHYIKISR